MRTLFHFPNPVNEVASRIVAAGVVVMVVVALALRQPWMVAVLAYGFVARVATGPTLSPLGQLATRYLAQRLPFPSRPVPGAPKRFAQGIGAVMTVAAAVLVFGFAERGPAWVLLAVLGVFALLESALGLCMGCKIFAVLARAGLVPEAVCEECNDLSLRARRVAKVAAESPA